MGRKAAKASTPISVTGTSISFRAPGALAPAGFSLLELLVVLAIIGVVVSTLVFSARNITGSYRQLEQEAFRLRGLIELLREEALMQNRDYGIEFAETGYRFYVYDYTQYAWVAPPNDVLFSDHAIPDTMMMEIQLEDREVRLNEEFDANVDEDASPEPQLLVFSSGEATPFSLDFYTDFNGGRFTLTGEFDGSLEVSREGFNEP